MTKRFFRSQTRKKYLLELIENDIKHFGERVGIDRASSTLRKKEIVYKHLKDFIESKYKKDDFPIKDLNNRFIDDFTLYLSGNQKLSKSTIWVYCTYFKKIVMDAYYNGEISHNPFYSFHLSPSSKKREFLTESEIKILMNFKFKTKKLEMTRDVLVFSCFTGISFSDIYNLRFSDIKVIKGNKWIVAERIKSKVPYEVILIEISENIVEKYAQMCLKDKNKRVKSDQKIFNLPSYPTFNRDLKTIIKECGINKNITFHCARHTFATMAISSGMPIESISKVLGHTNIRTTQIYAKVTNNKLEKDFNRFIKSVDAIFCT